MGMALLKDQIDLIVFTIIYILYYGTISMIIWILKTGIQLFFDITVKSKITSQYSDNHEIFIIVLSIEFKRN